MGAGVLDGSHEGNRKSDLSPETVLSDGSAIETSSSLPVPATAGPGKRPGEGDDEELVLRARQGDFRAWELIVDRHLPMVNAIARSYRLPAADREDAVQTVWLILNQQLPRLRSPDRLRSWLRRVTKDTCSRQRRHSTRQHPVDPHVLAESSLTHAPTPEAEYLRKEREEELHRAVRRLDDPVDRHTAQYHLDQAPAPHPAEEPGNPRTTANQRRRMIRRLRRILEDPQ